MRTSTTTRKLCRRCDEERPAAAFSVDRRNRDGLHSFCKACRAAEDRARRAVTSETTDEATEAYTARERPGSGRPAPEFDHCADPDPDLGAGKGWIELAKEHPDWPQPFPDDVDLPPAIVERRQRVLEVYRRLDARRGQR